MNDRRSNNAGWLSSWLWLSLALTPLLARLAGGFIESSWWGLNHLFFADDIFVYVVSGLTIAALGVVWFRAEGAQHSRRSGDRIWNALTTLPGSIALALFSGALFWVLSDESHLFGSGYARVGNLTQRAVPFTHGFEFLATQLTAVVYYFTEGITGRALNDASLAIKIISTASGGICVALWALISQRLGSSARSQTAFFLFLLCSGATALFFGNGDLYAPAALLISLFIWITVSALQTQSISGKRWGALGIIAISVIAPLYLAQFLFLLPATLVIVPLILSSGFGVGKLWTAVSITALIGVTGAVYIFAANDLWIQARLVGISEKPPEFDYWLLAPRRLYDLFNTGFALWPLLTVTSFVIVRHCWSESADRLVKALSALTISSIVWILVADYPGGSTRELISLAPFALPASALGAYLWNKRIGNSIGLRLERVVLVALVGSFVITLPVYTNGESAVEYLDHDYQSRTDRYRSGLVNFRDHYFFRQEFPTADKWEQSFNRKSSIYLDHESVRVLIGQGDYSGAHNRLNKLIATHRYWGQLYATLSGVFLAQRNYAEAMERVRLARQLAPAETAHMLLTGDIYQSQGNTDSAFAYYSLALRYDIKKARALMKLGMLSLNIGDYEQALKSAYLIFEENEGDLYSVMIIGLAAYQQGDLETASRYLRVVDERGRRLPEAETIKKILRDIDNRK